MKSAIYSDINQVAVVDKDIPEIAYGEALLRIAYSGICGTDLGILAGKHPRAQKSLVFGHEFVGRVERVDGPAPANIGDPVAINPLLVCGNCFVCKDGNEHICKTLRMIGIDVDGGMAEYVKVPVDSMVPIRDSNADEKTLALAEPVAVAVHAIRESGISPSQPTAIIGAGPIGLLIAYLLRYQGNPVCIADINPGRLELAGQIPGVHLIDASRQDVAAEIIRWNSGEEVKYVFEASGAKPSLDSALKAVSPKGTIVLVGTHKAKRDIDLLYVLFNEITLTGVRVYRRTDFERAVELLTTRNFDPSFIITHVFPLDQIDEALEVIESGGRVGKVLIKA